MTHRLQLNHYMPVTVIGATEAGDPVGLDGSPIIESDPDVVEVDGDRLIARSIGIATITAVADAVPGPGIRTLVATATVEVVAEEASSIEIAFGEQVLISE